ncbi:hypothetical protein HAX54_051098 [Datura stramonium]|uniref:Leucine-rich repeat-containing N-terminal plant-type domain-containing protein n=1 Tax=Datura stramonium TaxID=4076 RepID=A0ABS8SX90_DATST|nr:hypothetical protein [Datura stramonium]
MALLFFFYSLILLLIPTFSSSFLHLCSSTDASALLQFKQPFEILSHDFYSPYKCDYTSFPKTKSWNESRDCCTWDGVSCDLFTGHVIGLDLSCSFLGGTIHPNSSLFQLHHLHTLNLAFNDFYPSSIPNGIGRLRNLRHLNLSESFFQGKIPTEISYLSNLVSLDLSIIYSELQLDQRTFETMLQNFTNLEVVSLSGISISSPIPVNMSSSLRYLDLQYTNLRGVLPERLFLLPNLERLKLGRNDLIKGVLPKLHPSSTLLELDISNTGISGELPDSIGTLSSLSHLNLYGCDFSGPIPDSIGNLTQIRELDLGDNRFTGRIPSTISKLKRLTLLYLSHNSIGGEIPDIFSNLQELGNLYLSNNSFSGPFPSSILSLTRLQGLVLSRNSLSGPLPSNASMLQKLQILSLSHNQLSGSFPQSLANLPNLLTLVLSSNNITFDAGIQITFPSLTNLYLSSCEQKDFPHFLRNVKTLEILDISNNKIRGQIPKWFSDMRWDSLRNSFTGSLPPLCAQSTSLSTIVLNGNRFEGTVPMSLLNCYGLEVLDVGNNAINDTFPARLGTLQHLQVLILRSNKFHGPISTRQKFWFSSLRIFDLSHNEFSGSLPAEVFRNFKAMIKSDGTNKGYIGYMSTFLNGPYQGMYEDSCGTSVPQPLESEEEGESCFFSGFTWESVVIGYSFGLVVGTVTWSLMFKAGKPKWFVEFFEGIFPKKMRRPKKRFQRRRT